VCWKIQPGFFFFVSRGTQIEHPVFTRSKKGRDYACTWKVSSSILICWRRPSVVERDEMVAFVPMLKEKRHQLTVLSLCGTPHWDCKPGKRLQQSWSACDRHFQFSMPSGNAVIKKSLLKSGKTTKMKEVFRLYNTEYEGI